ncbi:hypothetical protein CsatB_021359 [Cannabis sativa]
MSFLSNSKLVEMKVGSYPLQMRPISSIIGPQKTGSNWETPLYRKDSVMEVTEEDYKKCNSSHPNFFSNNGHTLFKLNETHPFYFISGVFRHCQKGQHMIIKVKTPGESPSDGGGSGGASSSGSAFKNGVFFFPLFLMSFAAFVVV